ncbi:MAG: helix-turn-helix domain-containing protein [Burkholderiales bacterium]|nr:helix-turn-helix domain-containing protein [Burkholderiales bacterium]
MTTASVPQRQRLEYWLEMVCSTYCHLECDPPEDMQIFGDIRFGQVGAVQFTELLSNCRGVRRTQERIRSSDEDDYLVLVQREGSAVMQQDGRTAILNPGDFVFHACSRPYELHFDQPRHHLNVLRLKRSQLENHVGDLDELTATTVSRQEVASQLLLSMIETLHRNADQLHPSSAPGVSDAITSIIGAGLRSLPKANLRKTSNLTAYHLARIKAHVQKHLHDPNLSVGSIASAMQLSPDHVCKLFRGEPTPLSRLIWRMRLDACRRDLADPRQATRSMSDIAFSWGFNDAAHFSRTFRERLGMSPRQWRNQELLAKNNK